MSLIAIKAARCTYHLPLQRNSITRFSIKAYFRYITITSRRTIITKIAIPLRFIHISHITESNRLLLYQIQRILFPESRIIATLECPTHHTVDKRFYKQIELMKYNHLLHLFSVSEIPEIFQFLMHPKRNAYRQQLLITIDGQTKNSVSIDIFKTYLPILALADCHRNPLHTRRKTQVNNLILLRPDKKA